MPLPRRRRPPDEGRLIQLVYYGYVAASALVRMLPERFVYSAADFIGGASARRSKKRHQVARNLSRIVGEPPDSPRVEALVVEAYRSYARYWLETFRLVREDRGFFLDRVRAPTQEKVFGPPAEGRGAIVVIGHLGNYDAAGAWVGASGYPVATVAEVLKPRRMFEFFADHRSKLGITIYPAEKGVTAKLREEILSGHIVAILGDRDLKGTGPEVTFFGEAVTFPAGAASLALDTGAPIMVAGVYSEVFEDNKHGWSIDITDHIDVPRERGREAVVTLTQRIATELERMVARRPEEWHVFQPFWDADRRARATS